MLIAHKEPIRDTSFVLPFGRWKGHTIKDVLFEDPHYLTWLAENTDLDLHADILDAIGESFEEAARNAKLR
jgi:hypothetical protein